LRLLLDLLLKLVASDGTLTSARVHLLLVDQLVELPLLLLLLGGCSLLLVRLRWEQLLILLTGQSGCCTDGGDSSCTSCRSRLGLL